MNDFEQGGPARPAATRAHPLRDAPISGQLPAAQGLYDPAFEHDACGMGFVAHLRGRASHGVLTDALRMLSNLSHRGAAGRDPTTGDGAGVLTQLPDALLRGDCAALGVELPSAGRYGVGVAFLPQEGERQRRVEQRVQEAAASAALRLLGWRDVPVDAGRIGRLARESAPVVRQFFVSAGDLAPEDFERRLYLMRRLAEKSVAESGERDFHVPSLSGRTIVYKGLMHARQVPDFYVDLRDERYATAIALVHARFSTNTFPTWARAHPYRLLCHNGEINTLRGNVNWTRVREAGMMSSVYGDDLPRLFPVLQPDQSDSATLDNALEFLVRTGRSLPHAMLMLIPEAWEGNAQLSLERRAFFEYHAAMTEPWDGPAAVAFSDGIQVGATLDRNGLRPGRWLVTHDDIVALSSEAGALPVAAGRIRDTGRLRPGKLFLVDTWRGRIIGDDEVKDDLAGAHPYRGWLASNRVSIEELPDASDGSTLRGDELLRTQRTFGYTQEELRMLVAPMAGSGEEAVGSMGNDAPLAVLSDEPQPLFAYFRQLFAQVTNPAIDPIRERLVMSLAITLGPNPNVLADAPEHVSGVRVPHPVPSAAEIGKLRALDGPHLRSGVLDALWPAGDGPAALEVAVDKLCVDAEAAVRGGVTLLIITDRRTDADRAPIPSLLATAAVHHQLARAGLRADTGLVIEAGDVREVAHVALLLGYGAGAVSPYLLLDSAAELARRGDLPAGIDDATAVANVVKAVGKGLLKIFSKMGISTVQSYCGAQIFEALGLARPVVDRYFSSTPSRIGGVGLDAIARDVLVHHGAAFADPAATHALVPGGTYHYRARSEHHAWHPETIATLQRATRTNDAVTFRAFSDRADADNALYTLRGHLDFTARDPVLLADVEPAANIVKRFTTGAMSFGSLGAEAHETLALAMNRIGGRSNTGEGGEDPTRFGTARNSRIKQVASGRFGVTTDYLVSADELQIKIAQGAKPGEGGQLPGHKVDGVIAAIRFSTPGVSLISPPPHHDIYSIEDLAQLIFDLRNVNPTARIAVKLVAEAGVGTVAAGVAKAHADVIVISGDSGGTGASPLSSVKHAGVPWELGLAETQQTLVMNGLRANVRLQTDGQLKTGRDVVIAAMLGAEEFGFSTAPLIVEGCIMMRKCHLNTCPVGVATQDPVLRAKFRGQPEHVVNYFFFVAEQVRELLAKLGARTVDEIVGRTDLLTQRPDARSKAAGLDLAALLARPTGSAAIRHGAPARVGLDDVLDHQLLAAAQPVLTSGTPVRATFPISNADRATGTMLSGAITKGRGRRELRHDAITFGFTGTAGQSFGAFLCRGITLSLDGPANDYVGKGLSGGRLVIRPPQGAGYDTGGAVLIGNTALYGATGGDAYIRGSAGERFAVRNSGATAVVEGVGDHGCEYMTGGTVVVLGTTGRNFAAGMSGGVAYVLDDRGSFERRCNRALVELGPVPEYESDTLRVIVERHARLTESPRAMALLGDWERSIVRMVRVMPTEYRKVLEANANRGNAVGHGEGHGRPEGLPHTSTGGARAAAG